MLESVSLQQLHYDEGSSFRFPDVVNRADVRMIERRGCLRLSLESLQRLLILGHFFGQELQGHEAREKGVSRFVDNSHATATQLLEDVVVRNHLSEKTQFCF